MKSEISRQDSALSPEIAADSTESGASTRYFRQQLSSTPRGARLARLLSEQQLTDWGWPRTSERGQAAAAIVAELASNAVTHGRLPGRDFLLTLRLSLAPTRESPGDPTRADAGTPLTLRIEVSDARGERRPVPVTGHGRKPAHENGHGLLLVAALATGWGVSSRPPSGKTVWAEISTQGQGGSKPR